MNSLISHCSHNVNQNDKKDRQDVSIDVTFSNLNRFFIFVPLCNGLKKDEFSINKLHPH